MKGRFWRKALAASLALLIVTGSVPIKPISNVFESMAVMGGGAFVNFI